MKGSTRRFTSSLLSLLLFVAAFVIFFELVQPAYSDLESAKGKLASQQDLLATESSTIAQVKKLVATYGAQAEAQGLLALAVPTGENLAGAVAQVYGVAHASGITVQNMGISVSAPATTPGRSVGGTQASAENPNLLIRPTGTIAFAVTANGNYESFLNFLSGLESNIRLFDVRQVAIQPAAVAGKTLNQDNFTYLVTVNTYYQAP